MTNYYNEKEILIQRGLLNITIPSEVSDTATTSICASTNKPPQNTGIKSKTFFMVTTDDVAPASDNVEPPYDVCGEAKEVNLYQKCNEMFY